MEEVGPGVLARPHPVKLTVNGDEYDHGGGGTLMSLLSEMEVDPDRLAVMINDEVVGKSDRESARLEAGDHVEVLTFAQGG